MTGGPAHPLRHLRRLARLFGVQTAYVDTTKTRRTASPETLLAVLRALGAPVAAARDAPGALREVVQARWRRPVDPVAVAWEGRPASLLLRLPKGRDGGRAAVRLEREDGEVHEFAAGLSSLPVEETAEVEGVSFAAKRLFLPEGLPWGYHRAILSAGGTTGETLVVATPRAAHAPPEGPMENGGAAWGVFLPLYALRTERDIGSGDLSDLEALMDWAAAAGGRLVGTLPLLAAFLDEPFHPSPYAPASRLFWNEFFLDVTRAPGFAACAEAQALLSSEPVREEIRDLRAAPLVDYRRGMALRRRILEALARAFFAGGGEGDTAFRRFASAKTGAEDYARFRAAGDAQRLPWPAWPAPLRDGILRPGDFAEEARRYHLYVQWAFDEQMRALAERARRRGQALYLDLPLGVHHDSYDVWRFRDRFALTVSGGAPPDDFFIRGQSWGFPPLHPERIREDGYRYLRDCLRHQFAYAGILRIDHVMGLHRLFWVPHGMEAAEGTYVRYPAEELYAVLVLESRRYRARVVGEDLGTVAPYVRPAMARHGLGRLFVTQFSLSPEPSRPLAPVPRGALASLNTHDMPPFAAFWEDKDIEDRAALGLFNAKGRRREEEQRRRLKEALEPFLRRRGWLSSPAAGTREVLAACLAHLAASSARAVVVNLEDLWLETLPQNVPGTWTERPNWKRKARHSFEEFRAMPGVAEILRIVDGLRRGRGKTRGTASPPQDGPG
jgi:4-alpha-glucanotransferase